MNDHFRFRYLVPVVCATLICCSAHHFATADDPPARKVTEKDMPRIPHTEPDDALKTFQLAKGCRLELVAAEPLVADPVDACFDELGRMYVAEMHGYPFSQEPTKLNPRGGGKKDAGIIRLLEDTNDDGRMDRSVVFADKLSWPTSVCCYDGGLFVLAPQYLYYFKDTDGDDRADVREVVLSGFGRGNVQSLANNLKWGLDNKIYFATGRNPKKLLHRGKPLFSTQGSDLRFDPKTEKFELATGGLQFGHSMDNWGNRFVCSNSNHIQQVVYPQRYLARNPYLAVSGLVRSIAADGASARVFRTSPPEPWRIIRQKWRAEAKGYRLVINDDGAWEFLPLDPSKKKGAVPTEYPVGYFTSATGVTIYRGGAYPREFQGNAFVGDVGGNIVHRKHLKPKGVVFSANRADSGEEFIRSSDNWFRPVNFVNAPDGSLYVLDMYRETVEHPYSIPEEIKKFLHLQSGSDRGRIYRIVTPDMKRIKCARLGEWPNSRLVAALDSDNAWNRQTAQRLLWQRQDKSVVPSLARLVSSSKNPLGRLHALCTLASLNALSSDHVVHALKDPHPRVREHAVRLSESLLSQDNAVAQAVLALCGDDDDRVRFQLAFSLGEADESTALGGLLRLARNQHNGGEIRTALLSSVAANADQLVIALIKDPEYRKQPQALSLLSELCEIVGANRDSTTAQRVLAAAASIELPAPFQQSVLFGLGEGLNRRGSSVPKLLGDAATPEDVREQTAKLFERAARVAGDDRQKMIQRVQAVLLLAFASSEVAGKHLPRFLSPRAPQSLQLAAAAALGRQESASTPKLLLRGWRAYSPAVRREVIDALLSTVNRIDALLTAIEGDAIKPSELERDKKQLLLKHPSAGVRKRSMKLFGSEVNSDRTKVVAELQRVLDLDGDINRGRDVFGKKCSVCHRVGDVGHAVAPDLASVQNKSTSDLLISILDPNREAQPNFNTYNVRTESGKIYSGIIAAETANSITLRRSEAKEDVILRSAVEELTSTGVSLMPEGLEKDLSPQDLADVISFVKSIKAAK
jgi:putative membrane-bound dehydrogenase-like protein